MILAGDIGGTKTALGLFENTGSTLKPVREARFPSRQYGSLEEILKQFFQGHADAVPAIACFGVAGAVIDGKCQTTNLPWTLDETVLAAAIGARRVKLLNDLAAMAYGMLFLRDDQFAVINRGNRPQRTGTVAVIAAGTGLGEAILHWDGQTYHPAASEGGHVDFAPRTEQEIALLRFLQQKFGHVSYERILSGPGLFNIYSFLRSSNAFPESPTVAAQLQSGDAGAVITQAALAGQDPLCTATLDLFATLYGAEAGNLALKCVAIGGVYIGGGIAPRILPFLQKGFFMQGFLNKGRFAEMLQGIDIRVALEPEAPLLGASHYAQRLAEGEG